MRMLKPVACAALLGQLAPAALLAQLPSSSSSAPRPPATLALDEAIALAHQNNPLFLQTANSRKTADSQLRSAYGALLPSSSASFYAGYQQGGDIFVSGGSIAVGSDQKQSQYNLNVNYRI